MNTKNTKTAVIILLLIANIFFVYNRIELKVKSENIPSEMIDNAVSVLEKNGFTADKSKIPSKKPTNMIYEGVYSHNFADIVINFSGVSREELNVAGDMSVPAGIAYTAGDYKFIFSEDNYFKISIIEKSYAGEENNFAEIEAETRAETELLSENGTDGVPESSIKKAEKIIKNFIKKYKNQDIKLGFEITGFRKNEYKNCECVLISQTVDGAPINFHTAYIEIQDEKVKYFSGEWYFGEFVAKYTMPLLDSVNILFKCMDIDGEIIQKNDSLKEMTPEYNVMHHDTEGVFFYLYPSWSLEFESGKKLSYDMIAGNKKL